MSPSADYDKKRVEYREHIGPVGEAEFALQQVIEGKSTLSQEFKSIPDPPDPSVAEPTTNTYENDAPREPTQVIAAKRHEDGSIEMRRDTPERAKAKAGEPRGKVDYEKTKTKAKKMINQRRRCAREDARSEPQGEAQAPNVRRNRRAVRDAHARPDWTRQSTANAIRMRLALQVRSDRQPCRP